VLDEMRDAASLGVLMAGASREPHADTDRTDLRHPLRQDAEAVIENVANNR